MWKLLHVCTLILTDHYENEGAQWILLMDLLKLICLSVIAKLVGLKWGDGNMNHYA